MSIKLGNSRAGLRQEEQGDLVAVVLLRHRLSSASLLDAKRPTATGNLLKPCPDGHPHRSPLATPLLAQLKSSTFAQTAGGAALFPCP